MLVFPCTHSMGLKVGVPSVFRVIHKSKYKKMQLNLANCEPAITVIYRTIFGISFRVNHDIDIGVTRMSKFPINLRNEVCSTMERGVYNSSHRRIVSSFNCNSLDIKTLAWSILGQLVFYPFQLVFEPSLFDQCLQHQGGGASPTTFNAHEVVI